MLSEIQSKCLKNLLKVTALLQIKRKLQKKRRQFYSNLFKKNENKTTENCNEFLNNLDLPKILEELNENLKNLLPLKKLNVL